MLQVFFLMLRAGGCSVLCRVFFCYAEMFVLLIFPLSTCLVLCRPCFFLCPPPPPAQSINILFMLTLCMENAIGRMCKLCTCTRPGVPRLVQVGIDPMAFTHHDVVLEVPLKCCVVQYVAASLKLKRSPAQSTSMLFMFTLTLCMECME